MNAMSCRSFNKSCDRCIVPGNPLPRRSLYCTWYTLHHGDFCFVPGIPSTTEIVLFYQVYPLPRRSLYCIWYTLYHGDRCIVSGIPSTTEIVVIIFLFFYLTYSRWTSSLPSCLWSLRIFPSLPGSRLTIFYRDASSAILQLINQWLDLVPGIPSTTEIIALYLVYPQPRRSLYCTWYTLNHEDRCIVPGIPSTTAIVVLYPVYPLPRRSLCCTWYTLYHGDRCIPGIPSITEIVVLYLVYPQPRRSLYFYFLHFFHLTYSRWTSSLPSCLWSLRIFPSLPGSRLTIFHRVASSALLQLVNQ